MRELLIDRGTLHRDRIAIVDPRGRHRYADLVRRSAGVAGALLGADGDLAGRRVAFLVPPGFDHVALQWGIWRAGGVAVPLALSHPAPELDYILGDALPSVVVADPSTAARLEPLARARGIRFALVGDLDHAGAALPVIGPDRDAMMIYTSGTTGRAKGVVTTQGNLRAQITTLVDAWEWRPDDRILHLLPLHHVHGIVNVLCSALWVGAVCEFAEFEPGRVWDRLASGEVTLFMAVPTIYHRLAAQWDAADSTTRARWSAGAARLRLMVSGSAALPVATLARWREITGHTLLERYGMTEIGMGLTNPLHGERRPGTVGRPFPGVEVRLTDEAGLPVASGEPGQIEIKGPQVFKEYWRRPEATAAAFREGWFLTGDVAVIEDGYYRILGRQSVDLIKSAGYKISALEIEELLREHPAVRDCAVVGVPDPDLGERVAAAVIAAPDASLDRDALRAWARERMAPYKIPRDVRFLSELPRNAMGKVTKPELRTLFAAESP
jgi:malonyl-CoA/methylmalonyl-CoA synthetase